MLTLTEFRTRLRHIGWDSTIRASTETTPSETIIIFLMFFLDFLLLEFQTLPLNLHK